MVYQHRVNAGSKGADEGSSFPSGWTPTHCPQPSDLDPFVHRSHSFAVPCSVRPSPVPSPRLQAYVTAR